MCTRIYRIITGVILLVWLSACQHDSLESSLPLTDREGYLTLNLQTGFPSMEVVQTRAVDPDGGGVQHMTLFCFDAFGLFITTVQATLTPTDDLNGSLQAEVPNHTRIIHFIANQNMTEFQEDNFRSKSETEVMSVLEGSSGRMIYWARFACDPNSDANIRDQIRTQLNNTITLVRNHAKITIADWQTPAFVVTGFEVVNANAFGTVAPYNPDAPEGERWNWPGKSEFITLPLNDAKMSNVVEVSTATNEYIFESRNSMADPVSVIIRGHLPGQTAADDLYYRVMLLDKTGEPLLLRRNFHYQVHIQGALRYGKPTFEEATRAAATNNVWISISDEINEVEDRDYVLAVERTFYVIDDQFASEAYTLPYTVRGKNGTAITASDRPEITWLEDNQVATPAIGGDFTPNGTVGNGSIRITLLPLGDQDKRVGTLLVKKGRLQRKIKVMTIRKQQFVPAWVGTQVYGKWDGSSQSKPAKVTLMFTVPESCPEELFPMRVLISTNELDVRSEAGVNLPVINDSDKDYGEPNQIGYKYVYTAEAPGVQRIYFENILDQKEGATGEVWIEAPHFELLKKTFTYSLKQRSITVEGLMRFSSNQAPGIGDGYPDDETIFYTLVPQKRNAPVRFDMVMKEQETLVNAGANDEFLLYSQYLDYNRNGDTSIAYDCSFTDVNASEWSTGGRVMLFEPINPDKQGADRGKYHILLKTTRPVSAEVVRIASNQPGSKAGKPENADANGIYRGNAYRSVTFELANYYPFRLAARIGDKGTDATAATPEPVDELNWTYQPNQPVDLSFEITSFQGTDQKSADPFGESFEIYIDAPMLRIDASRLSACRLNGEKLKADPTREGRFIYTVDADREKERQYGTDDVKKQDPTSGVSQRGERKTLPFLTDRIVSAGDIRITSNKEKVMFFDKTFQVKNSPISGTIQYRDANGTLHPVSRSEFVSFERKANNSRIGAVTITSDGRYELLLRKEYSFNWNADAIELSYDAPDGSTYTYTSASLALLFASPDIVLESAKAP